MRERQTATDTNEPKSALRRKRWQTPQVIVASEVSSAESGAYGAPHIDGGGQYSPAS